MRIEKTAKIEASRSSDFTLVFTSFPLCTQSKLPLSPPPASAKVLYVFYYFFYGQLVDTQVKKNGKASEHNSDTVGQKYGCKERNPSPVLPLTFVLLVPLRLIDAG